MLSDVTSRSPHWTHTQRFGADGPSTVVDVFAEPIRMLSRDGQLIAQAMSEKAVSSGKGSAAQLAQSVFDAWDARRFRVFSHPHVLGPVQTRLLDVMQLRNPSNPFASRTQARDDPAAALRDSSR